MQRFVIIVLNVLPISDCVITIQLGHDWVFIRFWLLTMSSTSDSVTTWQPIFC